MIERKFRAKITQTVQLRDRAVLLVEHRVVEAESEEGAKAVALARAKQERPEPSFAVEVEEIATG